MFIIVSWCLLWLQEADSGVGSSSCDSDSVITGSQQYDDMLQRYGV